MGRGTGRWWVGKVFILVRYIRVMAKEHEDKKRAALRIMDLAHNGRPREVIVYRILIEFGFSERFVDKVLKAYSDNQEAIKRMENGKTSRD